MDDLVIEGKTYLSSKRAAEVTGYAKDYVGQLCREGRVEARLVGRSWYVLERSIREHRFGKPENTVEEAISTPNDVQVKAEEQEISPWNSPKYVSEEVAPLPPLRPKLVIDRPLNLLSRTETSDITNVQAVENETSESRLSEGEFIPEEVETVEDHEKEVTVAIHKVPEPEKEPQLATRPKIPQPEVQERRKNTRIPAKRKGGNVLYSAIVISITILALTIILIGTGYIDSTPYEGKNESIIDYLGGKSFYSKQ